MKQGDMGDIIYKCRSKKKLTQKQLAEMIGVTNKAVSKWERGEGFPDITLLPILAEALDISVETLFNISQEEQKECEDTIIQQHESIIQEPQHEEKSTCSISKFKILRNDVLKAICVYGITLAIAHAIEILLWHLEIVYLWHDLMEVDFLAVTGVLAYRYMKNKHL